MMISVAALNWPAIIVIILALIVFMILFFNFRKVYPHIKRLEAVVRSPVFNACSETVDSLLCIRAFRQEEKFRETFRFNVNVSASLLLTSFSM